MITMQHGGVDEAFASARVFVTGGYGFIGSNLIRRLVGLGAQVTAIDALDPDGGANEFNLSDLASRVTIHRMDLRDGKIKPLLFGQEYVFHLAARTGHLDSVRFPLTDLDVNVRATLMLLEACMEVIPEVRIVFGSTRQVYGPAQYLPVDEAHPLAPPDFNAVHKIAAESYLRLYHQIHGLRSTTLRLTNTYGPRMRVRDARQMFLGVWIKQLLEGRPIEVYGDGLQRRDFNHVDDVVEALLVAARATNSAECFNLGSDDDIALKQVAALMTQQVPNATFELVPFPPQRKAIDIGDFRGDYSRFNAATGWKPRQDFAQGLKSTIEYFASHREHYW